MFDEEVVNLGARVGSTDDEMSMTKIAPGDLGSIGQFICFGKHDEDALRPEMLALAIRRSSRPGQKRDIQLILTNSGEVLARCSLDEIESNIGMPVLKCVQQIGYKSGGERRENTDPNDARIAAAVSGDQSGPTFYLSQSTLGMCEEILSRKCKFDSARMAVEQRRPKLIFQIADTPTDSGLMNSDSARRTPKTVLLGSGDNVAEMSQFYPQPASFHCFKKSWVYRLSRWEGQWSTQVLRFHRPLRNSLLTFQWWEAPCLHRT